MFKRKRALTEAEKTEIKFMQQQLKHIGVMLSDLATRVAALEASEKRAEKVIEAAREWRTVAYSLLENNHHKVAESTTFGKECKDHEAERG